jgi:hypothetical protein
MWMPKMLHPIALPATVRIHADSYEEIQGADPLLKAGSNHLKVPKCEIFDRSDFHYFYTIKPSWVDDFVVKILTYYFIFWGSQASFSF